MPLSSPWYDWYPDETAPSVVGAYELAHITYGVPRLVYVGQGRIRARIRAHARNDSKQFSRYRCLTTRSRRRAKQIERRELRQFCAERDRLPKYNQRVG